MEKEVNIENTKIETNNTTNIDFSSVISVNV